MEKRVENNYNSNRIYDVRKEWSKKMKKEKKIKNKEQRKYDKGQVFVKIMAAMLAIIMIMSIAVTLIYSLI